MLNYMYRTMSADARERVRRLSDVELWDEYLRARSSDQLWTVVVVGDACEAEAARRKIVLPSREDAFQLGQLHRLQWARDSDGKVQWDLLRW